MQKLLNEATLKETEIANKIKKIDVEIQGKKSKLAGYTSQFWIKGTEKQIKELEKQKLELEEEFTQYKIL